MATVGDILRHLLDLGLVLRIPPLTSDVAEREVSGIRADDVALPGDVSWLSPRVVGTAERITRFGGTLLLVPEREDTATNTTAAIVQCPNPKLAFIHLVDVFLPDVVASGWPDGAAHVDSSAVIGRGVRLGRGVVLGARVVLEDDVHVGPNSCIAHAVVRRGTRIGCNTTIGGVGFGFERDADGRYRRFPHVGGVVIGEGCEIGSNTCIDRGALGDTVIGPGCKIDNLVHIAHNATLEADVVVIAHAMVAGSVHVGEGAWIAPSAAVMNQLTIGAGAVVGLGAVVVRSVEPKATVVGNPAHPLPRKP